MTEDRSAPAFVADYRTVFESAPDGILIVDEEGAIRDLNPAAVRMFGHAAEELIGESVEALVPEGSRARHARQREAYAEEPIPRPMGIGMELEGRRRDGSLFPVEISLSPFRTAEGLFVIAIVRDLTERRRLRRFGAESLRAMEDERQRIARELHDDMAQRLSALLLMIRLLDRAPGRERDETLQRMREQVLEAIEGVRRIARGLRPPALADAGLAAAIRAHVRELGRSSDLDLDLDLDPVDASLDEDQRLVVYRVVQEALNNVVRHARARRARVSVHRGAEAVVATVRDDGVGFRPDSLEYGEGLGLLGMEERAEMVGGAVHVESRPGEGTTIRLEIPVGKGEADDV